MPGEIIKGAQDAEDALKRFKEDQNRFVRPIVCFPSHLNQPISCWLVYIGVNVVC